MGWQMIPSNVAGKTKRTVVSSATFVSYCVGNIVGTQVFRANDAPKYIKGTTVVAAAIGAECVVCIAWRFYYVWQNKKRDAMVRELNFSPEEIEQRAKEAGAEDKTDRENIFFRWVSSCCFPGDPGHPHSDRPCIPLGTPCRRFSHPGNAAHRWVSAATADEFGDELP
jgi:hypothetical protein